MTEFDDPCRSGAGRCNDSYQWEFTHTQSASGTAHLTKLSSSVGFDTINYDLQGTTADIPPPGWNRQQKMRYAYMFTAVDQDQPADDATEIELALQRYTDILDGEEVVTLSIEGQTCADTDVVYRRYYRDDLYHKTDLSAESDP